MRGTIPMLHALSVRADAMLKAALRGTPLLAFDFDGTLAPITARPGDVRVSAAVESRMKRLTANLPVAIVSGRDADDLAQRLAFQPRFVIGNHGAQDPARPWPADEQAALDPVRQRLREHAAELAARGVTLEDKRLSLALHYRLAADKPAALAVICRTLDPSPPGIGVFGGKCVVNVVAQGAPDKAASLMRLVEATGASSVVFAGDDVNDEPVFAAAPPHWFTVRVGFERTSRARFFLSSQAEVASLLQRIATLVDAGGDR